MEGRGRALARRAAGITTAEAEAPWELSGRNDTDLALFFLTGATSRAQAIAILRWAYRRCACSVAPMKPSRYVTSSPASGR